LANSSITTLRSGADWFSCFDVSAGDFRFACKWIAVLRSGFEQRFDFFSDRGGSTGLCGNRRTLHPELCYDLRPFRLSRRGNMPRFISLASTRRIFAMHLPPRGLCVIGNVIEAIHGIKNE
jgi:hypothetical protein